MKTVAVLGRAMWLALVLWIGGVSAGFAHALPGSTLVFSQGDGRLVLSVTLPLEDLIIAAPDLAGLDEEVREPPLSQDAVAALAVYFADHLRVEGASTSVQFDLRGAALEAAFNAHVGAYDLLTLEFDAALDAAQSVFPLTLTYDAVMHEVRNHRAQVFWTDDGAQGMVEFGYRAVDGAQVPVILAKL